MPFNIASYALLTHLVAQVTGLRVGELVHTFGDAHLYLNHLDQARLQLARVPRPLPRLALNPEVTDIDGFDLADIQVIGLRPLPGHQGAHRGMTHWPAMLSIVVAMARNGVIGLDGTIPWRLPGDQRRVKATTMGHVLVMGRRTYESIGRPLPGRTTVVVTQSARLAACGR